MKGQMKIQVLGSGCTNCKKLYESVAQVAKELQLETEVEYVVGSDGLQKMIELGALGSPVIAIDDAIVMTGYTADKNKIISVLQPKQAQVKL
jgi:small redox-active disulfide protein 2